MLFIWLVKQINSKLVALLMVLGPVKYESNGGASILNIWNIGTVTFDTDSGMDLYYGGNLVDSDSSATGVIDHTSPRVNIAKYQYWQLLHRIYPCGDYL